MRIALACLVVSSLVGCATARPLTLPNGTQGQAVSCNTAGLSMADCYVKAGQVCPAGYDILDAEGEAHPLIVASGSSLVAGSIVSRSLLIKWA